MIDELVEPRAANHLRLPELSQTLVTALQLAVVQVLTACGISPQSVVGHSSWEIAAAVASGYITQEEAITIAYYRGKAAMDLQMQTEPDLGMLAVGLSRDDVQPYLVNAFGLVQIGCVNSPSSVTLSGKTFHLENIKTRVEGDGHFARLLLVNLAYHSDFMTDIAAHYKNLLQDHFKGGSSDSKKIAMFSSVTGRLMDGECSSSYWQRNMVSPVLFHQAVEEMVGNGPESADFLIEIGPSGALAGPISDIKKSLDARGASLEYCAALKRGAESVNAIFDVAGRVFISGGCVDISKLNEVEDVSDTPRVIVDLPNYRWNHSTRYWHESDASKDWRFRRFGNHDLLGSKIMGTPWHSPSWKKILRLSDVPWLKDHKVLNFQCYC